MARAEIIVAHGTTVALMGSRCLRVQVSFFAELVLPIRSRRQALSSSREGDSSSGGHDSVHFRDIAIQVGVYRPVVAAQDLGSRAHHGARDHLAGLPQPIRLVTSSKQKAIASALL